MRTTEEEEALRAAEKIYEEPSVTKKRKVFKTVKKGEEIVVSEETQKIGKGGNMELVTTITIPVTACGKKISSEYDIAGFCFVCDEAVCKDHANYCEGYENVPCQKLLCPKHILYFQDEKKTRHPCCVDHYNMRVYYQRAVVDYPDEEG